MEAANDGIREKIKIHIESCKENSPENYGRPAGLGGIFESGGEILQILISGSTFDLCPTPGCHGLRSL